MDTLRTHAIPWEKIKYVDTKTLTWHYIINIDVYKRDWWIIIHTVCALHHLLCDWSKSDTFKKWVHPKFHCWGAKSVHELRNVLSKKKGGLACCCGIKTWFWEGVRSIRRRRHHARPNAPLHLRHLVDCSISTSPLVSPSPQGLLSKVRYSSGLLQNSAIVFVLNYNTRYILRPACDVVLPIFFLFHIIFVS